MATRFNIYRVQGKTILTVPFQYRIGMVIWMMGLILEPVIYLVVWTTAAGSTGGHVGTISTEAVAADCIVLILVNHATFSWVIWGLDARIRQGSSHRCCCGRFIFLRTITGRLNRPAALESIALATVLLAISRWIWTFGVRHYSGASA